MWPSATIRQVSLTSSTRVTLCFTCQTRRYWWTDSRAGWSRVANSSSPIIHGKLEKTNFSSTKRIFISPFLCCNISCPKPWSDDFTVYVEQRGYDLFTVSEYESLLNDAGFVNVKAEDKTSLFIDYLVKELENFVSGKEEFLKVTSLFLICIMYDVISFNFKCIYQCM